MSSLEILSFGSLSLGVAAILRFVWLDSLRFGDIPGDAEASDPSLVSPRTVHRLSLQADAARVEAEIERFPRAA